MPKRKSDNLDSRLNLILAFYSLVLFVILVKLFLIQVVGHEKYSALAQDQYWNLSVIPAQRGDILTSDSYTLASTQIHYLLYLEPQKAGNSYETAQRLGEKIAELKSVDEREQTELLGYYHNKILNLMDSELQWAVLSRNLTPDQKDEIEKLNLLGIGFEEDPARYYPEGSLASHVLGFVAFNDAGDKQGYFGIEGALNGDLRGKPGRLLEEQDATGNPILIGSYKKSQPVKGRNIVLTINRAVQYIVEQNLKRGVEEYDAKSGSVIVMDPFTGEIIAMANYPTYKPDDFSEAMSEGSELPEDVHRKDNEKINLGISQTYEPGSVIKPFTISSAVDLGLVNANTTFEDSGPVVYSGYTIDNWDGKHHGTQTVSQLLEKSNNIGAAWVGHLVGTDNLAKYLKAFGFGEKSNIELEGEDTGVIRDSNIWTDIDLANIAFGQGLSATPLQVLNGFNVIANGGTLMQPKIIKKIVDEDKEIDMPVKEVRKVVSEQTSEEMVKMLENAVESGEAKFFNLKEYRIAGKTGTAQIPFEGKYDPNKTNATFVGFLAGTRKFSMIVKLEETQSSIYAAETAVPLWMNITDDLVRYFGIAPDKIL